MRGFSIALAALAFIGQSLAAPHLSRRAQTVYPGTAKDIIITSKNTINATEKANGTAIAINSTSVHTFTIAQTNAQTLPLSFSNNFNGFVNAYVTGLDSNNRLVMLQSNGEFYYPQAGEGGVPQLITADVAIPVGNQGSQLSITIPGYISSARVWFAVGTLQFFTVRDGNGRPSLVEPSAANPKDPNAGTNWGFVELTWNAGGVFANISYVDFIGLVLAMSLRAGGQEQHAGGLRSDAVDLVCQALHQQSANDGQPWSDLCMADSSGRNMRVMAPIDHISLRSDAWAGYYNSYIDQVWDKYSREDLIINTQSDPGHVTCRVKDNVLNCNGDNRGYNRPSMQDIWGCNSGPFGIIGSDNNIHRAVVPRLCAAFVRTTLLLDGGNVQPSLPATSYYLSGPTMWYSAFVHRYSTTGIGYAFSYDDVNPDGENASGAVATGSPELLSITIG